MSNPMRERRRHQRVVLTKPVLATVDSMPVFILDASTGGLRVVHRSQLPKSGAICRLSVPSESGAISVDCAVVHTTMQHASAAAEQLFSTGLKIVSTDDQAKRLSAIINPPKGKKGGNGKA